MWSSMGHGMLHVFENLRVVSCEAVKHGNMFAGEGSSANSEASDNGNADSRYSECPMSEGSKAKTHNSQSTGMHLIAFWFMAGRVSGSLRAFLLVLFSSKSPQMLSQLCRPCPWPCLLLLQNFLWHLAFFREPVWSVVSVLVCNLSNQCLLVDNSNTKTLNEWHSNIPTQNIAHQKYRQSPGVNALDQSDPEQQHQQWDYKVMYDVAHPRTVWDGQGGLRQFIEASMN